jgi:hypothetical protein
VSSLTAASQRLERELAAAAAKAGQQEGQLRDIYDLCNSQQGGAVDGARDCGRRMASTHVRAHTYTHMYTHTT